MTQTKRLYYSGHLIQLEAPHDDRVLKRYIDLVLNGGMSEDEFWPEMRKQFPILPLNPIRARIADGAISPAPAKTRPTEMVEEGWYWILNEPDGVWTIAHVVVAGGNPIFLDILRDRETPYDDIFEIGPLIPNYEPDGPTHEHEGDRCPLCPTDEQMVEMRDRNRANAAEKRRLILADIAAEPGAFVHVVEGYEGPDDRSPVTMLISRTLQGARDYCISLNTRTSGIFEITPHRLDDDRTGQVVLFHSIIEDGARVEHEGRFLRG